MAIENRQINEDYKDIVKAFVIKKMTLLLSNPDCEQKIREDKEVLDKLGIRLVPQDLKPFMTAMKESPLLDYEGQCVKDGQRVRNCFNVLADLFAGTPALDYYRRFAGLKLGVSNLSDFNYVVTALKILDPANWIDNSLNAETQQSVKTVYFSSIINSGISGEDKIYNLDILQHKLEIPISEEEKAELSRYLKQNIMNLVELIDQMRKTSFGSQPLPAREPVPVEASVGFPPKAAIPETPKPDASMSAEEPEGREEKKEKKFMGFLRRK